MIVFDIETGPLPSDEIRANSKPFVADPSPGEFDPSTVKTGNTKDEAKIAAKIEDARQKHITAAAEHAKKTQEAEVAYWAGIVEKAALSPLTGRVLAIGYVDTDANKILLDIADDESAMLMRFWNIYKSAKSSDKKIVGHNTKHFDLRFLLGRSWIVGIEVPDGILQRDRYWDDTFVDTMERWGSPVKLDVLARAFGVGQKTDGVDGSMFADLLATEPERAKEYLRNDVAITRAVAERMGVI